MALSLVFIFEHENFKKIYEPLNPDKAYRFRYSGTKDKDYVNGLVQLQKAFVKFNKENEDAEKKLPEVIIASGERDALNLAGFGYNVVWLNSETTLLKESQYRDLKKFAEEIFVLPDIDQTGKQAAINLALKYTDIRIIWLPEKLTLFKDRRGNKRKDFCDYVELYPKNEDFHKLVRVAMPLKFYDIEEAEKGPKYYFNNEQAFEFLWANGFFRIENLNAREGFSYIHIKNNIVREIRQHEPKQFILNYCKENFLPIGVRNMLHKSKQLSENSLTGLPMLDIDFTDFDKHSQYQFFENRIWHITAKEIKEYRPNEIQKYVWKEEVIPHKVKRSKDCLTITYNLETEEYDIVVNNTHSLFLKFLINCSRKFSYFNPVEEKKVNGMDLDN